MRQGILSGACVLLDYIWAFMVIGGIIYAALTGRIGAVSTAVIDCSGQAVNLAVSMSGVVALWCGIMEIAEKAGAVKWLTKLLSPAVKLIFSGLSGAEWEKAREYITVNFVMNILGTGWSATGPGLMAMKELSKGMEGEGEATDAMCIFLVMNISSLQLVPVNIIAYRNAYGAVNPAEIILPAFFATLASTVAALLFCRLMVRFKYRKRRER